MKKFFGIALLVLAILPFSSGEAEAARRGRGRARVRIVRRPRVQVVVPPVRSIRVRPVIVTPGITPGVIVR